MGRFLPATLSIALLALSLGCNRADQAKAKQEAHELGHKINQAVNSGGPANTQSAEEKLKNGTDTLRAAGEKAGVKLDHAALIAKAKARLASDVGLATATSISVDARGSVIVLRGTVSSEERKRQAEQAVRDLDGVTRVVNDITVEP